MTQNCKKCIFFCLWIHLKGVIPSNTQIKGKFSNLQHKSDVKHSKMCTCTYFNGLSIILCGSRKSKHWLWLYSGWNMRNLSNWVGTSLFSSLLNCPPQQSQMMTIFAQEREETQLSNLWWMPYSVCMGFGTAVKTGSSRRFKWYPTTYMWVSSWAPITVD